MSLTCVSAYFPVKNKHDDAYLSWFKNTLAINCPYVFFTTKEMVDTIKRFRGDLPTYYIECTIEELYTYRYKDKMITHPVHCPSVELNIIWNEKVFMIQRASELNPFNSDWFKWIDAGICVYRTVRPPSIEFPNKDKLSRLPKDKFIYSSSEPYNRDLVTSTNYYHHISGTYILHKSFIKTFVDIYKHYLDTLLSPTNIWTDQVIHTHIYKGSPELFYKLADGYGVISQILY